MTPTLAAGFPFDKVQTERGSMEPTATPESQEIADRVLVERAQAWRPWRAYAVQYLWSVDDHRINDWPPVSTTTQAKEPND